MLWQLVVIAAALGAAYYRWSRRRLYRLAREIPSGMKEYLVVGHAYKFLGSSEDRINALQEFGRVANSQGGMSTAWLCHRLFICMTDPEAIGVISKACLDKDKFTMKFLRTVLGNVTVSAPGASYAMLSMKTALANLVRRYKLLPPANMAAEDLTKPLRVKFDLMVKAVDNFMVRIEERKK